MSLRDKIEEYLDKNPCLSPEWKKGLIMIIEANGPDTPDLHNMKVMGDQSLILRDFMDFIEPHEGRRNVVYQCTAGYPTIGVGFNLARHDAADILSKFGYSLGRVKDGQSLPDNIITSIFADDVKRTIKAAKALCHFYEQMPNEIKLVLVDMAFNLGINGLSKFKKFLAALVRKDYNTAADEMVDSKWYHQVGNRSKKLVEMVRKQA